jgi:heme oxygenase
MVPGGQPLRALKERTQDLHQEAETYVRILDADAGLPDYARYLAAMHGFHAPLEAALAADPALAEAGFDAPARRKRQLLERDLASLGAALPAPCAALPQVGSLARRLGVAYVLEGSTLGGKFILARLPAGLAPLRGIATSFLDGYGAATGARWREFGAIIERFVTSETVEAEAVAGARDTFGRLIDWLARSERPDARRVEAR